MHVCAYGRLHVCVCRNFFLASFVRFFSHSLVLLLLYRFVWFYELSLSLCIRIQMLSVYCYITSCIFISCVYTYSFAICHFVSIFMCNDFLFGRSQQISMSKLGFWPDQKYKKKKMGKKCSIELHFALFVRLFFSLRVYKIRANLLINPT